MIFVLIVGPVRVFREALARALDEHPEVAVVGTAPTAPEALRTMGDLGPDVVLVDASAPDAVAVTREIATRAPTVKLVALAASEEDGDVIAYAHAGISAFVARDGDLEDVVVAAQGVLRGEAACTPRIAAALLRQAGSGCGSRAAPAGADVTQLTARERQIVALIDQGLSNREIATRLCIELSTVKNHVHNLLEKLGARGRAEAAARVRGASPRSIDWSRVDPRDADGSRRDGPEVASDGSLSRAAF